MQYIATINHNGYDDMSRPEGAHKMKAIKKSLLVIGLCLFMASVSFATTRLVVWAAAELTIAWDYNVVPEADLDGFLIYVNDVLTANCTDETARQFTFYCTKCIDGNNIFTMSAYDKWGAESARSTDSCSTFLNQPPSGIPCNLSIEVINQ